MHNLLKTATLAVAIFTGLTFSAFAHAHLAAASPGADSAFVISPDVLVLRFEEAVEPGFTQAVITDSYGAVIPTGQAMPDQFDPASVSIAIQTILTAGRYTVDWQAVGDDGHKSTGSYSFTVTP